MDSNLIIISAIWCPSCLILKKHLKKLDQEYGLKYKTLDYDLDDEEVSAYNVGDKLPVIIYKDKRLIGEKSYNELIDFFKECGLLWKSCI